MSEVDKMQDERDAEAGVPTEAEMRDAEVPRMETEDELIAYIRELVDRPHDYGTCVYAMSMAAVAAYSYVAGKLGATGFQASCADLDIMKRTRRHKYGFRVIDYDKLLYPQYGDEHFPSRDDLLDQQRDMLADAAREKLRDTPDAHPEVLRHWKWLAERGS